MVQNGCRNLGLSTVLDQWSCFLALKSLHQSNLNTNISAVCFTDLDAHEINPKTKRNSLNTFVIVKFAEIVCNRCFYHVMQLVAISNLRLYLEQNCLNFCYSLRFLLIFGGKNRCYCWSCLLYTPAIVFIFLAVSNLYLCVFSAAKFSHKGMQGR